MRKSTDYKDLEYKRLISLFDYDPITGLFTRIINCNRSKKGEIANCKQNQGYIRISIDGERYLAHRLAFLFMTGKMPNYEIDHINGVREDNRWCNLRECKSYQNKHNMKKPSSNSSGIKGVSWNIRDSKWLAQITCKGQSYFLGRHIEIEDARKAIESKRLELHKEYSRNE